MTYSLYRHTFHTQRKAVLVVTGIFIFALYGIATGGGSPTLQINLNTQFNLALGFLPALVLFAVALLLSSSITPEQHHLVEVHATQPRPYSQVVRDKMLVSFVIIIVLILFYLFGAVITMNGVVDGRVWVTLIGNMIFLIASTGLILFAIMAGRDARLGQIVALLLFIALTQILLPNNLQAISPITFISDNLSSPVWWLSRAGYALLGIGLGVKALKIADNTDYLLIGASQKRQKTRKSSAKVPAPSRIGRITKELPLPIAITLYEAYIILRQGFMPILFGVIGVFIVINTIANAGQMGITTYQIINAIGLITYVTIFLPFLVVDSTWRDAEAGRLDMRLATQSHRAYLAYKALGIGLATGVSVILGAILPYMLGVIAGNLVLFGNFTSAYWGAVLFGLLSGSVYLSVMGLFIGAILHRVGVVILRGGILLLSVILQINTASSLVGNILYPTGTMTHVTTNDWYRQFTNSIFAPDVIPETVVSFPILMLPLASALIQMGILWLIASAVFTYTTRER
ncbi:MAG: hypothetical protein MUE54_14310 [Anaerolineae bacterium]|nr:hypothetical protein [Anaerolineae bacterium]